MLKLMCVFCACLAIFPLCAQAQAKYEVATIMDVKVHQDPPLDVVSYDVSVMVGKTTYVVLFTPPLGENDVKYVAGRELLVRKGDNGKWQPNYSSMGGDLTSAALSNVYYPKADRGAGLVLSSFAIDTGARIAASLAQEFLLRRFTHRSGGTE